MANQKISAMSSASALTGTELIAGVQSGSNVSMTPAQIKTFASSSPTFVTPTIGGGIEPQGRLTLTSNTPVMTTDTTAATSIFYAPYSGNIIPIYDGTNTRLYPFSQLTMALDTTNQPINQLFDLFIWNNSGTIAIGAGPAWTTSATVTITIATPAVITWTSHGLPEGAPVIFTNTGGALPTGITAGTVYFVAKSPATNTFNICTTQANVVSSTTVATSGSQSGTQTGTNHTTLRGTGAGTTQISLQNGVWTNTNSITLTNGAGAGTSGIAANTATFVGTFYTTANGQTAMQFAPAAANGGAGPVLGVFNAYNMVPYMTVNRDNTSSWTYASTTWQAQNASANNRVWFIDGLTQVWADAEINIPGVISAGADTALVGVVLNSTTATPIPATGTSISTGVTCLIARAALAPHLGLNYAAYMQATGVGGTATYEGATSALTNAMILKVFI